MRASQDLAPDGFRPIGVHSSVSTFLGAPDPFLLAYRTAAGVFVSSHSQPPEAQIAAAKDRRSREQRRNSSHDKLCRCWSRVVGVHISDYTTNDVQRGRLRQLLEPRRLSWDVNDAYAKRYSISSIYHLRALQLHLAS